jgi:hypothetical protein
MGAAFRREKWWLAANAIVVGVWLFIASRTWGMSYDADIGIGKLVVELPLLVIAALGNLFWFGRTLVHIAMRPSAWRSVILLLVAWAIWAAALALDHSQWGRPLS